MCAAPGFHMMPSKQLLDRWFRYHQIKCDFGYYQMIADEIIRRADNGDYQTDFHASNTTKAD